MEFLVHQDRTGALASPVTAWIYEGRVARIHRDGDALEYPHFPPSHQIQYRDARGLKEICDGLQSPKPFTLFHPEALVSSLIKDGRGNEVDIVGQVIGARIEGDYVIARILISDQRAMDAIRSGMHELSLGYIHHLDNTKHQRNIQVDHLALVPKARCGSSCSLQMDCGTNKSCTCKIDTTGYSEGNMGLSPVIADNELSAKERHALPSSMFGVPGHEGLPLEDANHVRNAMARFDQTHFNTPAEKRTAYHKIMARAHDLGIDATDFNKKYGNNMDELQKQLGQALADSAKFKAQLDQLDAELKTTKTALSAAQVDATNALADLAAQKKLTEAAEAKATQAALDAAESVKKAQMDASTATSEAVKTRVQLLTDANRILGDKDAEGKPANRLDMNEIDIQLAVITSVDGADFVAKLPESNKKDAAFVRGVYAGSLARFDSATSSRVNTLTQLNQIRQDNLDGAKKALTPVAPNMDAETLERAAMISRTTRRSN